MPKAAATWWLLVQLMDGAAQLGICYSYSYSMGTGIYGSKPPKSEGAAQKQGLFRLPYIPGNRAITIIYPTSEWLQIMNKVRMLIDTIATEVTTRNYGWSEWNGWNLRLFTYCLGLYSWSGCPGNADMTTSGPQREHMHLSQCPFCCLPPICLKWRTVPFLDNFTRLELILPKCCMLVHIIVHMMLVGWVMVVSSSVWLYCAKVS